jgi:polysaccharide export outer membrane protein
MKRQILIGLLLLLFSVFNPSLAPGKDKSPPADQQPTNQGATPNSAQEPVLHTGHVRYQLCPGDILEINFPFSPEFNQTVTVQPDGFITLRGVGDLLVVGKTKPELTERIQKTYSKILHDPVVSVELKDFEKPYYIVSGEVNHPGKFDLRGDTTVTQGVAIAGGFNENAKHSQVLLFRRISNNWVEVQKLDLKHMLNSANLTEEPHLRPGDMLFVPKNTISKIRRFIPYLSTGISYNPSGY